MLSRAALLVVITATAAAADPATEIAAGVTGTFSHGGEKVAIYQDLNPEDVPLVLGAEWSLLAHDTPDELQRVTIAAGVRGERAPTSWLMARWRGVVGLDIQTIGDGYRSGFSFGGAASLTVPLGPIDVGPQVALAVRVHGENDTSSMQDSVLTGELTFDALFAIRIRE